MSPLQRMSEIQNPVHTGQSHNSLSRLGSLGIRDLSFCAKLLDTTKYTACACTNPVKMIFSQSFIRLLIESDYYLVAGAMPEYGVGVLPGYFLNSFDDDRVIVRDYQKGGHIPGSEKRFCVLAMRASE